MLGCNALINKLNCCEIFYTEIIEFSSVVNIFVYNAGGLNLIFALAKSDATIPNDFSILTVMICCTEFENSKYKGRSESNAIRFLFMTLSFKGTKIVHHKKVYSMNIS